MGTHTHTKQIKQGDFISVYKLHDRKETPEENWSAPAMSPQLTGTHLTFSGSRGTGSEVKF